MLEVKKDVSLDLYFNPTYGAVSPTEVTRRGTQVRQLVLQKAGARERLRHVYGNLKDKEDKSRSGEQYANYCYIASELVLYVILGWCASQVVQYQEKYVENEYAYCFVLSTTNLKDGDEYNDDAMLAAFRREPSAPTRTTRRAASTPSRAAAHTAPGCLWAPISRNSMMTPSTTRWRPAWGGWHGSADNAWAARTSRPSPARASSTRPRSYTRSAS